jgi:hypothetical protein
MDQQIKKSKLEFSIMRKIEEIYNSNKHIENGVFLDNIRELYKICIKEHYKPYIYFGNQFITDIFDIKFKKSEMDLYKIDLAEPVPIKTHTFYQDLEVYTIRNFPGLIEENNNQFILAQKYNQYTTEEIKEENLNIIMENLLQIQIGYKTYQEYVTNSLEFQKQEIEKDYRKMIDAIFSFKKKYHDFFIDEKDYEKKENQPKSQEIIETVEEDDEDNL